MLVSVIMPTYNCADYIVMSIDSVIAQTVEDWELVIIDDCSTDATYKLIKPYLEKYSNIHYHCLSQNCGPAIARTEGIKRAVGKYIAFLDSDDIWLPEKLERQIAFMEKNKATFSCTAYAQMDEYGNDLHKIMIPPEKTDYKKCILLSNPIGNLTVMYDQEILGKFEVPSIKKRNDFALWLQILKKTDACYGMKDVLAMYRLGRKGSVSRNKLSQMKYHWKLYHEIEKHNVVRSIFEVVCWMFVKSTGIGLDKRKIEKKIGVCGHFGIGFQMLNGQTIKTKIITDELKHQLGEDQVAVVDTHGGLKAIPKIFGQSWKLFSSCETVVMLPAYNGLRILTPVYSFYNMFFHRKIQYVVIGGWLPSFIEKHKWLTGMLKKFDGIFVETKTMKIELEKQGFQNVQLMPNFKNLPILKPENLNYQIERPYKLCTFSRVMKEKGIEDAIKVVTDVNEQIGHIVYCLDIYGQIDTRYRERFVELQKSFPWYIQYKGKVPFDKSVATLKNYFALLFPTQFYTEGIPGTVIDAYAAGVPVIASMWESFSDVINNNVTGIGYEFSNNKELETILVYIADNPAEWNRLKGATLEEAKNYSPQKAIAPLINKIIS